jgi:site-specific DNA-methyltransferase (cytosine-N4-specific)
MEGRKLKSLSEFPSRTLNKAINIIASRNNKRALEGTSFYNDLQMSIKTVSKIIKPYGYSYYIVPNRTVSSVILPTFDVIRDFFKYYGFEHIKTYIREIPNKRIPVKNSPPQTLPEKLWILCSMST